MLIIYDLCSGCNEVKFNYCSTTLCICKYACVVCCENGKELLVLMEMVLVL